MEEGTNKPTHNTVLHTAAWNESPPTISQHAKEWIKQREAEEESDERKDYSHYVHAIAQQIRKKDRRVSKRERESLVERRMHVPHLGEETKKNLYNIFPFRRSPFFSSLAWFYLWVRQKQCTPNKLQSLILFLYSSYCFDEPISRRWQWTVRFSKKNHPLFMCIVLHTHPSTQMRIFSWCT